MPTHLPSACAATNRPYLARYIQQGRAGQKKKKKSSKDTVLLASSYLGESLQGEGTYIDEKSFTLHKLR
jgi:hypothetical protein